MQQFIGKVIQAARNQTAKVVVQRNVKHSKYPQVRLQFLLNFLLLLSRIKYQKNILCMMKQIRQQSVIL